MDFQVKYDLYDTTSGTWVSIPNLDYHHAKYLRLSVPSGANKLETSFSGVVGELTAFGKAGSRPTWLDASFSWSSSGVGSQYVSVSAGDTLYLMVLGTDDPGPSSGKVRLRLGCASGSATAVWTDVNDHFDVDVTSGSNVQYSFFVPPDAGSFQLVIPCSLGNTNTTAMVSDPSGGPQNMTWNAADQQYEYSDNDPSSGCWTIILSNTDPGDWNATATLTIGVPSPGGWSQPTEGSGTWRWEIVTNH